MSSHSQSRTHRPAREAGHTVLPPSRPFRQDAPSHDPAHHTGHDFRRVGVFPAPNQSSGGETSALGGEAGGLADVPVAAGGGQRIPDPVRAAMEGAFAQDFGDVRVHTGPEARRVGALAYTRGSDLHFQPGRYDPFSHAGRSLLGHELTHVVQQRAGRVNAPQQNKAEGAAPINADAGLEAEADVQGARAARGERASVSGAGSGVQRKGEDAPIQRVTLSGHHNPNLYTQGGTESDELGLNALFGPPVSAESKDEFRTRMAGEMTTQKDMLAVNDEAAQFPMHPLAKPGPTGWGSFVANQKAATQAELSALSAGKTVNDSKDSTVDGPKQSGEFTAEGAPDLVTPRPDAVHTALPDRKPVTDGAMPGSSPFNGGKPGQQIRTLAATGGAGDIRHDIQNPGQTPHLLDNQGHLQYPREGIAARQAGIMATAKKADPFINELENTGQLSQHVHTSKRPPKIKAETTVSGVISPAVTGNVGDNVLKGGDEVYAYGAKEFGNRPIRATNTTAPADYPERALPNLTNPLGTDVITNAVGGNVSHQGRYHEADIEPAKIKTITGAQQNIGYDSRGAERLLYNGAGSEAETPDYKGGVENKPLDHRYFVTNDHYKSAVPVAPVQTGYAATNPYTAKYEDKLAPTEVRPLMTSLGAQDAKAAKLSQEAAGVDRDLRFQAAEPYREQAGADAKQSGGKHEAEEEARSLADLAKQSSARREAEEEARTQADLKALTPSEGVMAMYGMGRKGAERMAAQSLEQQHLGVQKFLNPGEDKEPPPMSEEAKRMYS